MVVHAGAAGGRTFRIVTFYTTWVLYGTLPFFAVGAFSANSTWFPQWLFYSFAALLFLELAVIAGAAFMAMPKYRKERALGYTTWPSGEEIPRTGT
ncbi:hypothetical protein [Arthrobacter sp. NyZ413]|uniref:hypothetical protein n=1 Tax=Arthrobacter sp. NyZ413 TaxID=3144669 RepID=UPI003BF7B4F2